MNPPARTDARDSFISPVSPVHGRKKIMVADDDTDMLAFVRAVLEKSGYRVFEKTGGETLLRDVFEAGVDLVLLDIMMPGIDGISACKAIKKNVKLEKQLPVIMLTAKGDRDTVFRALNAGADDYIVKPFTPEVLLEKVKKHLA